jgi:hypothetical protein
MGDTHIATLDGVRYDFQVVGEYTLVRSTKDDFAVQVRQVPAKQSRTVTLNQAMATKIGGKRVTIAVENGAAVLRIDGAPATDPRIRLSGGEISQSSSMLGVVFLLEWSEGTTVRVEQLGPPRVERDGQAGRCSKGQARRPAWERQRGASGRFDRCRR